MIILENCRPGLLVLPQSEVTLKPKTQVSLPSSNAEIERAVKAGWVRIVEADNSGEKGEQSDNSALATDNDSSARSSTHEWKIDYSKEEDGLITIIDSATGKSLSADIAERKGDQHYTLKSYGTVKGQQFWPKAQALEKFDANE